MLMTRYSEFLLTLQIIFRLGRKCNFTGSVAVLARSLARSFTDAAKHYGTCYALFN